MTKEEKESMVEHAEDVLKEALRVLETAGAHNAARILRVQSGHVFAKARKEARDDRGAE
jgi:hypothetical protein